MPNFRLIVVEPDGSERDITDLITPTDSELVFKVAPPIQYDFERDQLHAIMLNPLDWTYDLLPRCCRASGVD